MLCTLLSITYTCLHENNLFVHILFPVQCNVLFFCSTLQVRSCDVCHKLQKASGSLRPIPVPTKLWCQVHVGMDLIGPLPAIYIKGESVHYNPYRPTKWAEAASLPDKSAHSVATL